MVWHFKGIDTDQQGNMFLATADQGLLFFPKGDTIAYKIALANAASVQYEVTAIKSTKDKIWVFAANKGLYVYDYKARILRLINAAVKSANCMELADGNLWIGSNEGVSRFNIYRGIFRLWKRNRETIHAKGLECHCNNAGKLF